MRTEDANRAEKRGGQGWVRLVSGLVLSWALAWSAAGPAEAAAGNAGLAGQRAVKPANKRPGLRAPASGVGVKPTVGPGTAQGFVIAPAPDWAQWAPADALPAQLPAAPVQLVLLDRQTRVGGSATQRFIRSVRQVNDSSGLQAGAQIEIDFDPSYQHLALHRLEVLRGGQRIDKRDAGRVKLLHREPQLERQMIDGRMTASIVLDDVRVGDRIDWAYSLSGDNPVFGGRFVESDWTLGSLGPTALYRYRLLAPAGRRIQMQLGDPSLPVTRASAGDLDETVIERRLAPQFSFDPLAPGDAYMKDHLHFSEFADWAEVARWAQGLFAQAAQPGPEVLARAAAIRAQATAPADRLRLALELVQTEVRYFGSEIGENSHQPAAAEAVLTQRFGDCKDKVALLMALLQTLDIPATPVLVNARLQGAVVRALPSPLAFDHAIVAVVLDGQTLYLDGTRSQQTGPAAGRQPVGLGSGLLARDDSSALTTLPGTEGVLRLAAEDEFSFRTLAESATLVSRWTYHGELAESMRATRSAMPAEEFARAMAADYIRMYPGLAVEGPPQVEEQPAENAITVVQHYTLAAPWRFPEQRMLQADFAQPLPMTVLRLPDQNPRTLALRLGQPGVYRQQVRFNFDEAVFSKPDSARFDEDSAVFKLQLKSETTTDSLRLDSELRLLADRVEAAEWAQHRDRLIRVWPRLGIALQLSAVPANRLEGLRSELRTLDEDVRRGRIKVSTRVQADALGRVAVLGAQLTGTRLSPKLRVEALVARGEHLDHLAKATEAQADFKAALALNPDSAPAHAALAVNALLRGADDEAIAEADAALKLAPSDTAPLFTRAWAWYWKGEQGKAQAEFRQLLVDAGQRERGFPLIGLYLSNRRAGGDGAAAVEGLMAHSAQPAWPHALVNWLAGRGSFDDAVAATREDGKPDLGRVCELYFYAAERALVDGDERLARQHLKESIGTQVIEFNEHAMARRRLAALGDN